MSAPYNPYMNKNPTTVSTADEENMSMQESSPSSKGSGLEDKNKTVDADDECSHKSARIEEEEIDFEENPFQIPPSFNCLINEEMLCDDDHPYVFWALLQLPIPKDLVNPMAAVYDTLEEFVTTLAEEDPNFVVFPHNLSDFESMEDLPLPIETADDLLDDIDKWLTYFPQAKLRIKGGDTYMAVLISLSVPFPKLVKSLSTWMWNKQYGLWKVYLQSEQPTSLGGCCFPH